MSDNFLVVYRIGARFIALETPREARGLLPDEAWVFGRAITRGEGDIFHAVQPVLCLMKSENVHQVPGVVRGFGGVNIDFVDGDRR